MLKMKTTPETQPDPEVAGTVAFYIGAFALMAGVITVGGYLGHRLLLADSGTVRDHAGDATMPRLAEPQPVLLEGRPAPTVGVPTRVADPEAVARTAEPVAGLCFVQGQSYTAGFRLVTRNPQGQIEGTAICERDEAIGAMRWRYEADPHAAPANAAKSAQLAQSAQLAPATAAPRPDGAGATPPLSPYESTPSASPR